MFEAVRGKLTVNAEKSKPSTINLGITAQPMNPVQLFEKRKETSPTLVT
jgi:hypothetical protein